MILERLRAATKEKHERLDASLTGDLFEDRSSYDRFLRASLWAVAPLESALAAHAEELGLVAGERTAALREDLGGGEVPSDVVSLDRAEAYGVAYVLEGSTLGGVSLAKLGEKASFAPPMAYLRLRGAETMPRFKSFLGRLAAWDEAASEDARNAAERSAVAAFDRFLTSFARHDFDIAK